MEEIRHVTWDLDGEELSHVQSIQRIVNAGFPIKEGVALTMFAIVEGESGEYLKAWHANVERDDEDNIVRYYDDGAGGYTLTAPTPDSPPHMKVKSVDLGFMQFNKNITDTIVPMTPEYMGAFVEAMFAADPDLARGDKSAQRAFALYKERGFQPWFAYKPGTAAFRLKKRYGAIAFAQWLVNSFVGKDEDTNKVPRVGYLN
jgi:hypothetical protein